MDYRKKDRREEDHAAEPDRRSGADRRQYQRILVDLEVDYRCEDTFLFAYITDLSALGIFIRTNNPEPPGTHLNLRFTLPGEQKALELEGEVIWINPFRPGNFDNINPGMGVRFCDITPETKQDLVRLVRKIAYLEDDGSNPSITDELPAKADEAAADEAPSSEGEPQTEGEPNKAEDDQPVSADETSLKS